KAIHHKCVFHAERAAKSLVGKYLKDCEESIRKSIKEDIRHVFGSKEIKTFTERYSQFKRQAENYPAVAKPIFEMLARYESYHSRMLTNKEIPTTSNTCERAIKEFDLKYQNTMGYTSIYAVGEYVAVWVVSERLVNGTSWRVGKTKESVRAGPSVTWDRWLLAT
ncbi:MAG: hypothetical protein QME81_19920, partial [bacterium]|nr:hypothetical protein [bacterium]